LKIDTDTLKGVSGIEPSSEYLLDGLDPMPIRAKVKRSFLGVLVT
jgi:hypothetical protein